MMGNICIRMGQKLDKRPSVGDVMCLCVCVWWNVPLCAVMCVCVVMISAFVRGYMPLCIIIKSSSLLRCSYFCLVMSCVFVWWYHVTLCGDVFLCDDIMLLCVVMYFCVMISWYFVWWCIFVWWFHDTLCGDVFLCDDIMLLCVVMYLLVVKWCTYYFGPMWVPAKMQVIHDVDCKDVMSLHRLWAGWR